jgi:murein DD-endopeptidase MepM/ murein hydrolase activator NlpD
LGIEVHGWVCYIICIRTILVQFNKLSKPVTVAVFFILILVFLGPRSFGEPKTGVRVGILGGPAVGSPANNFAPSGYPQALLTGQAAVLNPVFNNNNLRQEQSYSYGSLYSGAGPRGHLNGNTPVTYSVKNGDTLSKIALDFGISIQTIIGANPEVKTRSLQIGQELIILPISGILYYVKDGETPESIASTFHLALTQLQEVNRSLNLRDFGPGTAIVIPVASPLDSVSASAGLTGSLNNKDYFIKPADGFNWGKLHPRNAVDIANACGTPILAAAEGLVVDVSEDNSWSSGYGNYITIEHPNNTKTRYAHLKDIAVSLGDYVRQGAAIGAMGETGEATGCHLHFEVAGAVNPFAR